MRISQVYQVETSGKSQVPLLRRVTFDSVTLSYFCTFIQHSNKFWQQLGKQQSLFQPEKPQITVLPIGVENMFDGNHNVSKQFFKAVVT